MRKGIALALGIAAVLATGCGSDDEAGEPAASTATPASEGFALGFAYGLEDTPIYQNVLRPATATAKELGVSIQPGSADSQCDKQIADIENMIAAGVKALTFLGLCGEGGAYDKVVGDAQAKGITVVSYAFQHPQADGAIQFNDEQGAKLFADHATAWIEENFDAPYDDFSFATLPCSFAPPPIQARTQTVAAAITELTGAKPYDSVDCALAPDAGKKAVDTYLQKDPGLDMVIGMVDSGAYGAYLSLEQAGGKAGEVYVGGMDGTRESIELLAEGGGDIYRFSGALPLRQVGDAVVRMPHNLINGTGSGSTILNYTAVTADDPAAAKAWLEENFLAFEDAG